MRNILLVFVYVILTVTASAQKSVIKGRIYDSIRHEGLAYTTVSFTSPQCLFFLALGGSKGIAVSCTQSC